MPFAGVAAQPIDQRFQVSEAAELAEPNGGFFEIDRGERVGVGAVRLDPEAVEKGASDQMWRFALHRADPEVDAGLAKIHRQQLRMGIGHVQDARVAKTRKIVDAGAFGWTRHPRQCGRKRGAARKS